VEDGPVEFAQIDVKLKTFPLRIQAMGEQSHHFDVAIQQMEEWGKLELGTITAKDSVKPGWPKCAQSKTMLDNSDMYVSK
jgi:hypothetical protein